MIQPKEHFENGYNPDTFYIYNYSNNWAPHWGHRSNDMICSRCNEVGSFARPGLPDRILNYHGPTGLSFCDECVFQIEWQTIWN